MIVMEGVMKKYITKSDRWFDVGTEAVPITEFWEEFKDWEMTQSVMAAIFRGIRNGEPDEESCLADEFEVIDEPA